MSEQNKEREALYSAAINCPHEIDSNRIVLHYDSKQPGHNALAQLGNRLAAALQAGGQEPEGWRLVPQAFIDKFKASIRATNPKAAMILSDEASELLASAAPAPVASSGPLINEGTKPAPVASSAEQIERIARELGLDGEVIHLHEDELGFRTKIDGTCRHLNLRTLKAMKDERTPYLPYLSDRADGVKGHYAIARWNPAGYHEAWNLHSHRWASCSDEVLTLEQATDLLRKLVIPTAPAMSASPATPTDARDEIIKTQRETLERTWHVLKKHGAHPGRTDDFLHDCVDRALSDARAPKVLLPMPELIDRAGCVLELRFEEESQAEEFQSGLSLPAPDGKAFPESVEFAAPAPIDRQGVAMKPTPEMIEAFKVAYKEGSIWTARLTRAIEAMLAVAPARASSSRAEVEEQPSLKSPLTAYGMLVRALRIVAGATLMDMSNWMGVKPSRLSAMEFGRVPVSYQDAVDASGFFCARGVRVTLHALEAARESTLLAAAEAPNGGAKP